MQHPILRKEASHGPESKQQTRDHVEWERSKKQIILYTRALQ